MTSTQKLPRLVTTCDSVRREVSHVRAAGATVGLVPTMGGLHAGHLSLVQAAKAECSFTIATIFVNPTQFGPHEDFAKYPRTRDDDLQKLADYGVDLVFAPDQQEMYPTGQSTFVEPPIVAQPLEGQCRPGHFRGVATVVLKLFNIIPSDVAYFGEKDYQQLMVVRAMVHDLNVPVTIRGCPIVRDADGLALSTRNKYLSGAQRQQALALSRSLAIARQLAVRGERNSAVILKNMHEEIDRAGITKIDYIALVDPDTLEPIQRLDGPARALVAAYVGDTRLIDNCQIG